MTRQTLVAVVLVSATLYGADAVVRGFQSVASLGSISGVLVTDEASPQVVRRAIVTVTGPSLAGSRSTLSDDEGRFAIAELPAGSYALSAARGGFVTSAYGAQRPARRGRPIAVGPGEAVRDLSVRIWRGAVLTGQVVDERGRPVADLTVRASGTRPNGAIYQSLTNNGVSTDASGRFRVFGLEPGECILSVSSGSFASSSSALSLQDTYVDRLLAQLRRRSMTPGVGPMAPTADPALRRTLAATIYYPAAVSRDEALPITLVAGQESSIQMTWLPIPAATVTGIVTLADGRPAAGASVRVTRVTANGGVGTDGRVGTSARADGTFELPLLPRGEYRISATAGITRDRPWAVSRFAVDDGNSVVVPLRLGPGITIQGRVEWQRDSDATPPPFSAASVALIEANGTVDPRASLAQAVGGSALGADGTFVLAGLQPDAVHRLVVHGVPDGWWPVSAILGTQNLLDGAVRLSPELAEHPLVIRYSDRPAEVHGALLGDPSSGLAVVVAFPQDPALRPSVARVQALQPDAKGEYRFLNLPPGQYFVGVVIDADPDEWKDPAFLERLAATAARVTVAKGERVRLDLKAGGFT